MKLTNFSVYQNIIHSLSERIVEAQKPIRILNSLKWPAEVEIRFFEKEFKELPQIDISTYHQNLLNFNPEQKTDEFYAIERDIRRQLGQFSGIGNIMLRTCREYREVIRLLMARGTTDFPKISQELYGSAQDAFYADAPTLKDLAVLVSKTLSSTHFKEDMIDEKKFTAEESVKILRERLSTYFQDPDEQVHVKLSDDIIADASAGADTIKLRKDMMYSEREIRIFEVHEGWVHIATTLNGLAQPVCTFLSKGPPSSTLIQEGLAIILEIFTFSSYPQRVLRLTNRIIAIDMVEQGADFLDVFYYYLEQGFSELDSYKASMRAFRGCLPHHGPFTKDLSYSKGFILIYNYIRLAIKAGMQKQIPLLFIGKTVLEDLPILADLIEEGIVTPPKYLPPQFKDLAALSAWMTYSLFLNRLNIDRLAMDYKGILHH